jgi:hypothetical protein
MVSLFDHVINGAVEQLAVVTVTAWYGKAISPFYSYAHIRELSLQILCPIKYYKHDFSLWNRTCLPYYERATTNI